MTRLFFLTSFLLAIITTNAFACDCDGTPTLRAEFKSSDKIFIGQVISIKPYAKEGQQKNFSEFIVEFKINTVYKGTTIKKIKIRTSALEASCGYLFKKGKTYLVYSFIDHNTLRVTSCSRTKEINEAKEDIKELNNINMTSTSKSATDNRFDKIRAKPAELYPYQLSSFTSSQFSPLPLSPNHFHTLSSIKNPATFFSL